MQQVSTRLLPIVPKLLLYQQLMHLLLLELAMLYQNLIKVGADKTASFKAFTALVASSVHCNRFLADVNGNNGAAMVDTCGIKDLYHIIRPKKRSYHLWRFKWWCKSIQFALSVIHCLYTLISEYMTKKFHMITHKFTFCKTYMIMIIL